MNSSLECIADTLIMEALVKDDPNFVRTAQDGGIMGTIAQGVKDYVSDIYDPKRPVSSIVSFMGPGLLWKLDFPWISVLYTVAEALGFDWKAFWSKVGSGIASFVKNIIGSKQKPSEDEASTQINDVVKDGFQNSFTGEVDKEQLLDIAKHKKFGENLRDALEVKAIAIRLQTNPRILKEAGVLNIFRGKLSRFFIRTITWLIKTALISLGLVSAAGGANAVINKEKGTNTETQSSEAPIYKLQVSPNVSPEMFTLHLNNMSNVWIERGEINQVEDLLKSWILSIYPQLQDKISDIENSENFQNIVNVFKSRNKLASGIGMISIPRPYQKKSDIVSAIVNGYLEDHPDSASDSKEQYVNNTTYK